MKTQARELIKRFVTVRTEEEKRRMIAGFGFGGLCGLIAAIGGIGFFLISSVLAGVFVLSGATGWIAGKEIRKQIDKRTIEE